MCSYDVPVQLLLGKAVAVTQVSDGGNAATLLYIGAKLASMRHRDLNDIMLELMNKK